MCLISSVVAVAAVPYYTISLSFVYLKKETRLKRHSVMAMETKKSPAW